MKKNKIVSFIVAILGILLIGIGGVFILTSQEKKVISREKDFSSSPYASILTDFEKSDFLSYDMPGKYSYFFYQNKAITAREIPNSVRLKMAFDQIALEDYQTTDFPEMKEITEDQLKQEYEKLFGPLDIQFENFAGKCHSLDDFYESDYIARYDNVNKKYQFRVDCDLNLDTPTRYHYISNIVEKDNQLIFYEKVGYFFQESDNIENEPLVIGLYQDSKQKKLIQHDVFQNLDLTDKNKVKVLRKYSTQLQEYQYTFIKDKDRYYFKQIEPVYS